MKNVILNDLFDYNLKIYQSTTGFKFSLDSILLAEYVHVTKKEKNILDLCSGNAAIPLILSRKTASLIDAFELQEEIYNLARKSIEYNHLDNQIKIYNEDVLNITSVVGWKKYDIITCNPPYFKVADKSYINSSDSLAIARHEVRINLEDIFKIASQHLNTKGEFYLVHRVLRLDEIIILANKYKLAVKNIALIKTKESNKPSIVLVRCIKDAKMGIKIDKIINVDNCETYQNIFKEEV